MTGLLTGGGRTQGSFLSGLGDKHCQQQSLFMEETSHITLMYDSFHF